MKKIILLAIPFIIAGCTHKRKWESATVQYAMTGCYTSLKVTYDRQKFADKGRKWNDQKAVGQCSCTVDDLREKVPQEEFMEKMEKKQAKQMLSGSSTICKEKLGEWYDE